MATLVENLISYIADLTTLHVGEVAPEDAGDSYVWIMQSGEQESECMAIPAVIETVFFDIEVVGQDIEAVRELTEEIKEAFREEDKFPIGFDDLVETFAISNHDDNYIPKQQLGEDKQVHIGALSLTVHLVT